MGGAVAIGGLVLLNKKEQEKRADRVEAAQKQAGKVETAARANDARRSRRQQIREANIRRASVENTAATSGQTGSSAAVAAGDSLTAKLATNVGTIQQALQIGSAKSLSNQAILDANRKSGAEILSGTAIQVAGAAV